MSLSRLITISVVYLIVSLLDLFLICTIKSLKHSIIIISVLLSIVFSFLYFLFNYTNYFTSYYNDLFFILILISTVSFPILFLIKLINKGFIRGLLIIVFLFVISYFILYILNIIALTIKQYNEFTNLGLFLSLATFTKVKIIPYSEEYYSEDTLSNYIYPNHVNVNNINEAKATISFVSDFIELFLIIFSLVIINRQTIENMKIVKILFIPCTPFRYVSIYISTYLLLSYVLLIYLIIYIIFYCTGCIDVYHHNGRVVRHKSVYNRLIYDSKKIYDKFKSKNHNC